MRQLARLLGIVLVVASCTDRSTPVIPTTVAPDVVESGDPVVVAAGDLVCGPGSSTSAPCKHVETAALVTSIAPSAVLIMGDIQYEQARLSDFNTYYQPSWGAFKSITWPSSGNHEYQTPNAAGYFDYFNGVGVQTGRAGTRGQGYYSFNLGAWHIISLNSNCGSIGGCGAGSPQEAWLRADLAANPAACTLAYWHHPLFSSGAHGNNTSMQALWKALYDFGADLVLAGHDHNYERFGPQSSTGFPEPTRGIRSFVVGVGGKEMRGFGSVKANSELRNSNSLGVLKLTLHAASYDWQFVPIPGHTLADAGTASCMTPPLPPPPPPTTSLTLSPSADAYTFRDSPNSNFGTRSTLLVDRSPEARTYFKFNVSGIGSKTVVSARLRLYAVDPSDAGGRLHRVTSTSWTETTIRWSNHPSYSSTTIGSIGAVASGAWYEIDVKSVITSDGTFAFALESSSTNGADYVSREGPTSQRPHLVIIVQ
jgi:acid phosphatase type 7